MKCQKRIDYTLLAQSIIRALRYENFVVAHNAQNISLNSKLCH